MEKCRRYHENKKCEKLDCEIRDCPLRHPKVCRFFTDFRFCKFGEWCKFSHEVLRNASSSNEEIERLQNKLMAVENDLKKNSEKVLKLENEIKDIKHKLSEKEQTVSKVNKKFNFLKEKVTLLFHLEAKFDDLEKKFEKISDEAAKVNSKDLVSQTSHKAENTGEIKGDH